MSKQYYAGYSYMGINFTFDSPCWCAFAFGSKSDRDEWVSAHDYNQDTGNYVAQAITRKDAEKILGCSVDSDRVMRERKDTKFVELSRNNL